MHFKPMNPIQWSPTVEDLEHLKKTKPRNRQYVSNLTDFLMEMFKMMPAAEVHGFMKGLESSRAGFSVESFRDLRGDFAQFPPDPPLSDPPPDYIEDLWDADYEVLLNSLTNVGVLECVTSNSYKLKQTYCDQVKNGNFALPSGIDDHFDEKVLGKIAKIIIDAQLKAKYTEEFAKLDSEFTGIQEIPNCFYDPLERGYKYMDSKIALLFDANGAPVLDADGNQKYRSGGSGFGAQHRQGAPMAGNAFGFPVKKFTRFDSSITEYQHTSDSRTSDIDNNQKYTYLDGKEYSVEEDAIPIWSKATATNRFIDTTSYRSDFKATDYTNLFYGTSPNLLKERDGLSDITSADMPSVPDYGYDLGGGDTIFKRAKTAFSGIYTRTNNGKETTPSFYEIAMDPDAPWNGGSGGWWAGKSEETLATLGFYLDVLMAESRRRYLSAMTELFGPSSQLAGFSDTKDRTKSDNNIDKRMIEWMDKSIGKETDNYKYSSGYKKSVMALFLLGNHAISNWFQFFGDGEGLYTSPTEIGDGTSWTSEVDNKRIPNFLRWVNVNVEKYKTDYLPAQVSGIDAVTGLIKDIITKLNSKDEEVPTAKDLIISYQSSAEANIRAAYLPTYVLHDLQDKINSKSADDVSPEDSGEGSAEFTMYFDRILQEFVDIKNGMSVMELSYELRFGINLHRIDSDGKDTGEDDDSYGERSGPTANYNLLPNSMSFTDTRGGNTWEETLGNFISNEASCHYMSVYLQRKSPSENQIANLNICSNYKTTDTVKQAFCDGYLHEGNAYEQVWMSHALTLLANSVIPDVTARFMVTNIFNRTSQNQFEQKKKKYEEAVEEENKEEARIEAKINNKIEQERKTEEAKAKNKKKTKK